MSPQTPEETLASTPTREERLLAVYRDAFEAQRSPLTGAGFSGSRDRAQHACVAVVLAARMELGSNPLSEGELARMLEDYPESSAPAEPETGCTDKAMWVNVNAAKAKAAAWATSAKAFADAMVQAEGMRNGAIVGCIDGVAVVRVDGSTTAADALLIAAGRAVAGACDDDLCTCDHDADGSDPCCPEHGKSPALPEPGPMVPDAPGRWKRRSELGDDVSACRVWETDRNGLWWEWEEDSAGRWPVDSVRGDLWRGRIGLGPVRVDSDEVVADPSRRVMYEQSSYDPSMVPDAPGLWWLDGVAFVVTLEDGHLFALDALTRLTGFRVRPGPEWGGPVADRAQDIADAHAEVEGLKRAAVKVSAGRAHWRKRFDDMESKLEVKTAAMFESAARADELASKVETLTVACADLRSALDAGCESVVLDTDTPASAGPVPSPESLGQEDPCWRLFRAAVKHWGDDAQLDRLVEVCGKVIAARACFRRGEGKPEFAKQIASLEIACAQARLILGDDAVDAHSRAKLERLKSLLESVGVQV